MAKSKYKYLFKNTFLFTISSFSSKILSFLLVPLYTTVLSTADYGTADMVFTTSSLKIDFPSLLLFTNLFCFKIRS